MSEKAKDALALSDELMDGMSDEHWNQLKADAAALLRTQHAAIERKDALLRQALDSLDEAHWKLEHNQDRKQRAHIIEAIRKELE